METGHLVTAPFFDPTSRLDRSNRRFGYNVYWKRKNALDKALGFPKTLLAGLIALDRKYAAKRYAKLYNLPHAYDNEADAYRHFTWNVANMRLFGMTDSRRIANIHEIYNGGMGTSLSSRMALWNNAMGRLFALFFPNQIRDDLDSVWDLAKSPGVIVVDIHDPRLANVTGDDWQYSFPPDDAIPEWIMDFLGEADCKGWTAEQARSVYENRKKAGKYQ